MNRCPLTYQEMPSGYYSQKGLRMLSPSLKTLEMLDLTASELRREAAVRAVKMSIQGVQPKLSAVLNISRCCFELVDTNGRFILKPQHHLFRELPENEDLTMRLAAVAGIEVPLHGLIYGKDRTLTYFIRRFDRRGRKDKLPMEDFAQLAGQSRDTKYNYSMEKLVKLIDHYCTFPVIEKAELFKRVLFNFLVGNEDMHLKNYSVITRDDKIVLSPAYDLLNTTIVLAGDAEEIALPLRGKKKNLTRSLLMDYFGKERCALTDPIIKKILTRFGSAFQEWFHLIDISFLSEELKDNYRRLLSDRIKVLDL